MCRYHLHARMFRGSLANPEVNKLQTAESDDVKQLELLADELTEQGFTCWLYERKPATPGGLKVTGKAERLVVIREWHEVHWHVGSSG